MLRLTIDTYWLKVAACAVVEQGLRASSLVWSLVIVDRAWHGAPLAWPLAALLVSILVPFALELVRTRLADAWHQRLYESVIDEYARDGRHGLSDWFADDRRDSDVPFMASEAHLIVGQTVDWFQRLAGVLGIIAFHAGVMSVVFSIAFGGAYALALVLGLAMSRWFEVRARAHAAAEQGAQAAVSMRLLGSWDNIVLGNAYNRRNWETKVKRELATLRSARQSIAHSHVVRSTVVFLVVLVPVAMQFARHFGVASHGELRGLEMAFLVATIPYAWFTLTRFPHFFRAVHEVPRILENLAKIEEAIGQATPPATALAASGAVAKGGEGTGERMSSQAAPAGLTREDGDEEAEEEGEGPHVEWGSLAVLSQGMVERPRDIEGLVRLTEGFRPGRFMVVGPAASGKTTLLLLLKARYPSQCFFFPGQNTLAFEDEIDAIFNPVEKLIACLDQIRRHTEGGVVLLDDWDVYLDPWSAEQVSRIIDDLAQLRCVIESKRVNLSEI